jgi:predicted metallo-beta-lactamase superfamily hydrolase
MIQNVREYNLYLMINSYKSSIFITLERSIKNLKAIASNESNETVANHWLLLNSYFKFPGDDVKFCNLGNHVN